MPIVLPKAPTSYNQQWASDLTRVLQTELRRFSATGSDDYIRRTSITGNIEKGDIVSTLNLGKYTENETFEVAVAYPDNWVRDILYGVRLRINRALDADADNFAYFNECVFGSYFANPNAAEAGSSTRIGRIKFRNSDLHTIRIGRNADGNYVLNISTDDYTDLILEIFKIRS